MAMSQKSAYPVTHHQTRTVDGIKIFYREAGPKDGPTVLLLHGFPTSSQSDPIFGGPLSRHRARLSRLRPKRRARLQVIFLHLREVWRVGGRPASTAGGSALCHVCLRLRRARRLAAGAEAS